MSNFSTYEKQLREEKYDNERYNSKSQNFNGRLLSAGANSIGNFANKNRMKYDSQGKNIFNDGQNEGIQQATNMP